MPLRWSHVENDEVWVDEHDDDFTCTECEEEIQHGYEIEEDGELFCIACYERS